MHKQISRLALLAAMLLAFSLIANAQTKQNGTTKKVLKGTAKTGVVVIGSAAKYTWKATKFTSGKVVKPLLVKSAPAAGKFTWKQSRKAARFTFPLVRKFAVTYLRFRGFP